MGRDLEVNIKGENVLVSSIRLINEDIKEILYDLAINTSLKDKLDEILFSDLDVKKKRIKILTFLYSISNEVCFSAIHNYKIDEEKGNEIINVEDITSLKFHVDVDVASIIYVANNGSDSNEGTVDSPLKTIGAALAKNEALDGNKTIIIRNGLYKEYDLTIIVGKYR